MKAHAFALVALALVFATGCRTAPESAASSGYKGIERIQILAKGME